MKRFLRVNFAALILIFVSITALGQSISQIENELVNAIKEIQKYSTYGTNYDEDKLYKANDVFEKKLVGYTKNVSTLNYKFVELNKLMLNATSEDGKFRIYSWDSETGGTMHDYSRVYQYQAADGKAYSQTEEEATVEDGGAGSFVYDIFTLDTGNGKIYIVCSTFIASTNDHYQSANLYKIEGDTLKDKVKLIKTSSGMTDSIGFEYNFFSVERRKGRPIKLISFDKKTKTLKIPVVIEDKEFPNGRVTNRFISYKFNGNYFVKTN
jgi:hypothetical protein